MRRAPPPNVQLRSSACHDTRAQDDGRLGESSHTHTIRAGTPASRRATLSLLRNRPGAPASLVWAPTPTRTTGYAPVHGATGNRAFVSDRTASCLERVNARRAPSITIYRSDARDCSGLPIAGFPCVRTSTGAGSARNMHCEQGDGSSLDRCRRPLSSRDVARRFCRPLPGLPTPGTRPILRVEEYQPE